MRINVPSSSYSHVLCFVFLHMFSGAAAAILQTRGGDIIILRMLRMTEKKDRRKSYLWWEYWTTELNNPKTNLIWFWDNKLSSLFQLLLVLYPVNLAKKIINVKNMIDFSCIFSRITKLNFSRIRTVNQNVRAWAF